MPPPADPQPTFEDALSLHQKGQVVEAKSIYQALLPQNPANADLLCLLGTAEYQLGHPAQAIDLFNQSLLISPHQAITLNNRGNALQGMLRLDEALASYDEALATDPQYTDAYCNRGSVLKKLNRLDEALASYEQALATLPDYAVAYNERGNVLLDMKRFDDALSSYDRALSLHPGYLEAHINRGNVLRDLGRYDEALDSYDQALTINPASPLAHNNRGNVLQDMSRLDEALSSYDQALAAVPDYPDALNNIGNVLQKLGYLEQALAYYDMALTVNPTSSVILNNRGNVLQAMKRLGESLTTYDQALTLAPDYAEAWNNRGNVLQDLRRMEEALSSYDAALSINLDYAIAHKNRGHVLIELNRLEEALGSFEKALVIKPDFEFLPGMALHTKMKLCQWQNFEAEASHLQVMIERGAKAVHPLIAHTLFDDPALQQQCAEIYAAHERPENPLLPPLSETARHDRIRIGYFSSDFGDHPVTHLLAGLFEAHDKTGFEIVGFSLAKRPGPWCDRVAQAFDQFIDVSTRSDLEIATLARSMQIDIAVDLNGFTQHARFGIFAERAAPIQVGYIGFLGTMGASCFDYLLADAHMIPEASRGFYTEQIAYLPVYQCNDETLTLSDKAWTRQEAGLPENAFVFCSFNNVHKITPSVFASWCRILKAVPRSVLWLYAANETARQNLSNAAKAHGLAQDRLVFAARLPLAEHLSRQKLADLFLDTFPYNAGATASNALRVGLPVLTRSGNTFASRYGASLLNAVGLPELVTTSAADYEKRAMELALDSQGFDQIRTRLAANRLISPLFATGPFARAIEAAYRTLYENKRNDQPATPISVSPPEVA